MWMMLECLVCWALADLWAPRCCDSSQKSLVGPFLDTAAVATHCLQAAICEPKLYPGKATCIGAGVAWRLKICINDWAIQCPCIAELELQSKDSEVGCHFKR